MAAAEVVQRLPLLLLLLVLFLLLFVQDGCMADTSTEQQECPHGGEWETSTEKCLMVLESDHGHSGFESVYEAAKKCRRYGGVIASVEADAVALTAVKLMEEVLRVHTSRQAYIGLNDIKVENTFTWFDGSEHHPRIGTWDVGEPNAGNSKHEEDCAVLRQSNRKEEGLWHDYPCCTPASIKAVLCQIDRQQLEEEHSETSSDTKRRFPEIELLEKTCFKNFSHCSAVGECLNGGSCMDGEDSHECICPIGYSGTRCENDVDECLGATCLNNATCLDFVGEFQCVCSEDFVGPSCETAICPTEFVVENSERDGGFIEEGSIASYACNPGYAFPSELGGQTRMELVCYMHKWTIAIQENVANYSLDLLQCLPICDEPLSFNNSQRTGESFYEGSSVQYTCSSAFDFAEGVKRTSVKGQEGVEFICSEHKWTLVGEVGANLSSVMEPDSISCQPICEEPFAFENSRRTGESVYEGSTVNYTCNPKFDFSGEFRGQEVVEFVCSDHKWRLTRAMGADSESVMKPNFIDCEPVCPEPIIIANSTRTGDNVSEGSIVRYTCDAGFQFDASLKGQDFLELKCKNHNWTVVQTEAKNTASYEYDACPPSEDVPPQKTDFPQCQAILCSKFPMWKGIRTESENRMIGDVIWYNCSDRKKFVDVDNDNASLFSVCTANRTWVPAFQRCKYSEEDLAKKIPPKEAPGAVAIGSVAIIFLSLELALVVLMDIDHLVRHAKMLKDNVASGLRRLIAALQ